METWEMIKNCRRPGGLIFTHTHVVVPRGSQGRQPPPPAVSSKRQEEMDFEKKQKFEALWMARSWGAGSCHLFFPKGYYGSWVLANRLVGVEACGFLLPRDGFRDP